MTETRQDGESDTPREPEDFSLDGDAVQAVIAALEAGDEPGVAALMDQLHPADVADLLEQLSERHRRQLLAVWGHEIDGDVLSEIGESIRRDVIAHLPDSILNEAVRDLDSDDVVDLVEELEEGEQDRVLGALGPAQRVAVEQALSYPEFSAGRLMQREVVRAPQHWTVGETIDWLRDSAGALPEQFYHVILVDPRMHPVGYVTLGKVLSARREVALRDITEDSFRTVPVDLEQGEVAYAFNQYHLISLPVVDAEDRLVGVITIDDAMIALDEEHEEDILRLAGVSDESSLSDRVLETVGRRLPWLLVNCATALLAATVIGLFDGAIEQLVALAILMPVVASMGGNAGTQSLTVAVRAIATKDLTPANFLRVVLREVSVGLINGLALAAAMGLIVFLWFGSPGLGLVIAAAMIINLTVAAAAGILVPMVMDRAGIDPALASGTFVTTVTDVVGFFAFLGLAALVLL